MLDFLIQRSKKFVVTLRFSILAIFVTLFILSMVVLITVTHVRFVQSIARLSFSLMQQASSNAFNQIQNALQNAEVKSRSTAQLIKLGIVDPNNETELSSFIANLMKNEISLFPSVKSIFWGDVSGNFTMAERISNGDIQLEIIHRTKTPLTHTFITMNSLGKILQVTHSNDFTYDPRNRPWFLAAKAAKKTVWLEVYQYRVTGFLGTSVATPVLNSDGNLVGVVNLQLRLDKLRNLVEQTKISEHSVVFILSNKGKLIAFPRLVQFNRQSLFNIRDLTDKPWIAASFDLYGKNHNPVFVLNYDKKKYLVTYQSLSSVGHEEWLIGIVVPVNDFVHDLQKTHLITLLINLGILIFGIIAVSILITRVVRPLKKITEEIVLIQNFELNETPRITSRIKEIGYIADALHSMKKGLRIFQRYIPATLVRQLIETGEETRIGGVKKPLAILFSDIKDFMTISEKVDPDELTPHLCEYFDELSQIIALNNGTIDKYIGDAIMAFWGAPQPIDQPALHAAKAALRCINRSTQLNKRWQAEGKPILYTRLGLHVGETIVGNFGSSERINYTAFGDTTNIASRLEGINKVYGTQIIVSDAVYQLIKDDCILRMIDCVTVKGKYEYSYIYELVAETRGEVFYDIELYVIAFAKGYTAYKNQQWDDAIVHFKECLEIYPEDTIAHIFIKRCENFKLNPPPVDWKGIWQLSEK